MQAQQSVPKQSHQPVGICADLAGSLLSCVKQQTVMTRTPQQAANEAASCSRDVPSFQRVDTLLDHPQDADLPVALSTLKLQEDNHKINAIDSSHLRDLPRVNSMSAAAVASATAAAIAAFTAGVTQDNAAAVNTVPQAAVGLLTQSSRKSASTDGLLKLTVPAGVLSKSISMSPKKTSKLTVILDSDSEPVTQGVSVVLASPLLQCHILSRSSSSRVVEPESPPSLPPATTPGTSRLAPRSIFK